MNHSSLKVLVSLEGWRGLEAQSWMGLTDAEGWDVFSAYLEDHPMTCKWFVKRENQAIYITTLTRSLGDLRSL